MFLGMESPLRSRDSRTRGAGWLAAHPVFRTADLPALSLQGKRMKVCDPMAGAVSGRSQVPKPCKTRQRAGSRSRLLTDLRHQSASCVSPGNPAQLVLEGNGDLGFEEALLLVRVCHNLVCCIKNHVWRQ